CNFGIPFPVLCCLLVVQIAAQDREGQRFCERLTAECVRQQPTVGTNDDTVGIYNEHCRRSNRNWRNITRCELVRASCILTMVRCDNPTCKNVADSLRS
ncbi:hypothetical protein KR018_012435, partial [Drosophila ironensis]